MILDQAAIERVQAIVDRYGGGSEVRWPAEQFSGHLFISHSGLDDLFIQRHVLPIIESTCGEAYFMFNAKRFSLQSPSTDFLQAHGGLVDKVLDVCKTVLIVVSRNSANSDWVKWETSKALSDKHPIVICKRDETHLHVPDQGIDGCNAHVEIVDFNSLCRWRASRRLSGVLRSDQFSVGSWKGKPIGTATEEVLSWMGLWAATPRGWEHWRKLRQNAHGAP